jgi:nitrogen regulatory protein P-II 1
MKLITAIIRTEMLSELVDVVIGNGGRGLTVTEVGGFGRQFGQHAAAATGSDLPRSLTAALLPKTRMELLVTDEDAEPMMEALGKHARTGTIGDGKIWVTTVDTAMRVRTGERDHDAV